MAANHIKSTQPNQPITELITITTATTTYPEKKNWGISKMENVFSTLRPEQIPSLNDKERWYCFGWSTINKAQPNLKSGDMDSYPGPKLSLWRFYQCKVSDSRRLFYHLSAELLSIEFIWTKTKAIEKASKSVGKRHKKPIYGDLKRKKKSNCIERGKTWVNKSLLVLVVYLIGWESNAGFFFFFWTNHRT